MIISIILSLIFCYSFSVHSIAPIFMMSYRSCYSRASFFRLNDSVTALILFGDSYFSLRNSRNSLAFLSLSSIDEVGRQVLLKSFLLRVNL